jgi:hypothetical protein
MPHYTATSLKAELNAKGWRMTPQREKILHVFQNLPKGNHLSAEELHGGLSQRKINDKDGNSTGIGVSGRTQTLRVESTLSSSSPSYCLYSM